MFVTDILILKMLQQGVLVLGSMMKTGRLINPLINVVLFFSIKYHFLNNDQDPFCKNKDVFPLFLISV